MIYDELIYRQKEGFLLAREKQLWGMLNILGDSVVPLKYSRIDLIGENLIVKLNDKFGVINVDNKQVVPIIYDEIVYDNTEDLFLVKEKKHWGLLDNTGSEIMPIKYEEINNQFSCHRLAVSNNRKWGFVNETGAEVIKCIFDEVLSECFEENKCLVKRNGEVIEIDTNGNIIK